MEKKKALDIKRYVKYVLKDGALQEKRDILRNLKSKIVMKEKKIEIS